MSERAKSALLGFAVLMVVYPTAELASRVLYPVSPPASVHALDLAADDLLFFRLHPNRPAPLSTNSLGLRGPEVPPKTPDEFRVLSLGESTTFGWEVEVGETYSAWLERLLPEVEGRSVRVLNAGVPAYTSFQGLTFLRHHGLALEPDAVLAYFGANDVTPVAFRASRTSRWNEDGGLTDRELFERRRRPLVRLSAALFRTSNLYRALVDGLGFLDPGRISRRPRVSRAEREQNLEGFRDVCAQHGIRFVAVIPWYRDFAGHAEPQRALARRHGIPVVDLPARLAGAPPDRYFADGFHPNAEGHRLIARELERGLRELWAPARVAERRSQP